MTDEFLERVRAEFTKQLPGLLPGFRQATVTPNRNIVFLCERRIPTELTLFVAVVGPADRNEFTIEAAWTHGTEYPLGRRCTSPLEANGNLKPAALVGDSFRMRPDRLWGMRRDHWWREAGVATAAEMLRKFTTVGQEAVAGKRAGETEEDFKARVLEGMSTLRVAPSGPVRTVASLVQEACDRLVKYVLPYFDQVVGSQAR